MRLTSDAFGDGKQIPALYTCEADSISPPLAWTEPPPETRSFALLCNDPDAPSGIWHHWAVYDIPADQRRLSEGLARETGRVRIKQGVSDGGRIGYFGPCPPHGHGVHRYQFRLLALSTDHLPVDPHSSCGEIERQARKHVLGEASLTGLFSRT